MWLTSRDFPEGLFEENGRKTSIYVVIASSEKRKTFDNSKDSEA